jgi:transposase
MPWTKPSTAQHCQGRLALFYLPAHSPEFNDVEAIFQVLKHHELPERSYTTLKQFLSAIRRELVR